MKARIPSHREFIINFPDSVDQAKANEGWAKLQQIVEDYKKAHNGASVYAPTFIEDCEPAVKKLQEEYGFEYTVEYVKSCVRKIQQDENSRRMELSVRRLFFVDRRRDAKRRALRVALADFSATPWRGLEKSERCPSLASPPPPQAPVAPAAGRIPPRK